MGGKDRGCTGGLFVKLVNIKLIRACLLVCVLVHNTVWSEPIHLGSGRIEFIKPGDTWRLFRGYGPPSEPNDAWYQLDFNDAAWEPNESGFGYGDGDDETVLSDMRYNYVTVYIRKEFSASSFSPNDVVELVIDYDDGFVAYLNGDEVERQQIADGPVNYLTTASGHEAGTAERFELGTAGELLNDGNNILAIEGHNKGLDNGDFSLIPALRTVSDIVLTEDTTWSGTYIIEDDVIVPEGNVLTIEPGTVLMLGDDVAINVYGQLLANGAESEPIRFTRYGAGTRWKQIMFVEAADSRLGHCIIEYSDCAGKHQDYYKPGPRDYHEAIVVLASHLDVENCTFQNLPDDSGGGQGDAIAIISDDQDYPGDASAHITGCQFLSIGQGIHTRFSYVLVEDCYFTDHHGDNDDVDLWGESNPPPLIRNNLFLNPDHDDMINPTKCSAIIIGNVIAGCDDHGVVLRDRCFPVMINNLIYNCRRAGIAVENTCQALLVNNTIAHIYGTGSDCAGIKIFDLGRAGSPYYLTKGGGVATMINCIVRDCHTSISVKDSHQLDNEPNAGSHVTVMYCDIEGGRDGVSIIKDGDVLDSTVTWFEEGNIDADPQFVDAGSGDYHLKSHAGRWDPNSQTWVADDVNSPCIDAGISYVIDDPNYRYLGVIDWRGELWPHGKLINMGAYGGTTQASMSTSGAGNAADLNTDGAVNFQDFARFGGSWPINRVLLPEDLDRSGYLNFVDVKMLIDAWLWQQ